jgi:hypothetical protein
VDLASRCGSLGGWLRGRPDSHMGIAILKYRLYEIDLIINRTLVYGALTVVLAGLFQAIDGALHYLLVTLAHLHSLPGSIIAALLSTLLHKGPRVCPGPVFVLYVLPANCRFFEWARLDSNQGPLPYQFHISHYIPYRHVR